MLKILYSPKRKTYTFLANKKSWPSDCTKRVSRQFYITHFPPEILSVRQFFFLLKIFFCSFFLVGFVGISSFFFPIWQCSILDIHLTGTIFHCRFTQPMINTNINTPVSIRTSTNLTSKRKLLKNTLTTKSFPYRVKSFSLRQDAYNSIEIFLFVANFRFSSVSSQCSSI